MTTAPDDRCVSAASLGHDGILDELLDRLAAAHPGGDRLAVASLWSQSYFRSLLIPALTMIAGGAGHPPLSLQETAVLFCPLRGTPLSLHVADRGVPGGGTDATASVATLLDHHVTPLIAILQLRAGLSARLAWSNAGWYMGWTLEQVRSQGPERAAVVAPILRHLERRRPACTLDGRDGVSRRRVCCLRYRLPGVATCGEVCPRL